MAVIVHEDFQFIVQGITGREALNFTRECLNYGSKIIGGVTPGKGGREVYGVPVYDTVREITEKERVDGTVITVPLAFAPDAAYEAIDAGIKEIIIATPLNVEGEATALYVADSLTAHPVKVSRIAAGVPHGGELEFTDQVTLGRAIEDRRSYQDLRRRPRQETRQPAPPYGAATVKTAAAGSDLGASDSARDRRDRRYQCLGCKSVLVSGSVRTGRAIADGDALARTKARPT